MNANELADYITENSYIGTVTMEDVATMLRQQQNEIEALRMGFAGSGTSDSELAEVRAMANRWFLEIQALKQIIDANNLIQNIGQFVKPQEKCPSASWWKGDPTCGGLTENYGLGKAQEK